MGFKQEEEEGCGKEPLDVDKINTVGCLELFERQFTGNMGIVGGKKQSIKEWSIGQANKVGPEPRFTIELPEYFGKCLVWY